MRFSTLFGCVACTTLALIGACAQDGSGTGPAAGGAAGSGATGGLGGGAGSGGNGATGGSSGTGGSAGTAGTAGTGGSAGTGGTAGTGGVAGSAGDAGVDASLDGGGGAPADAQADAPPGYDASACTAPPPDAGCAVGEYWHACKQSCVSCYDVSLLVFGDVTKVTSLSDSGSGTNQRFPRLAADGSSTRVVLTQGVPPTSPTHTDFLTGVQQGADFASLVTDLGNFVNYPGENESGPLLVPAGAVEPVSGTAAASLFLLMDSDRNGKQQIMSTPLFQGAGSPSVLAAPVNAGGNDYHVAYAHQATPARLFWSSDRAQPGLYTWAVTGGQAQKVAVTLPGGCAASDEDLEPWVTPDGTLLLFSSPRRVGPNCNVPLNGGKRSLYFAYLDPATGLPLADAVELASVRTALEQSLGKTDFALGTPSLDPTACTLYFSSDGDPDDADWDVYRSPR